MLIVLSYSLLSDALSVVEVLFGYLVIWLLSYLVVKLLGDVLSEVEVLLSYSLTINY